MRGRRVTASQASEQVKSEIYVKTVFFLFSSSTSTEISLASLDETICVGICLITQMPPDLIERLKDIKWFFGSLAAS